MSKIWIVDNSSLFIEGVKKVLHHTRGLKLDNHGSSGKELYTFLESDCPDLLILDIQLKGESGFAILQFLKDHHPALPVLVITHKDLNVFAVRSIRAGARGYIPKNQLSGDLLVQALRYIIDNNKPFIIPEVASLLADRIDHGNGDAPRHTSLSDRELEVFCCIALGLATQEIADHFHISHHTVHTYRARIREKMGMKSNVEIIRYALAYNLIS
ncbi:response regulator transcription factor [Fodinibius sediminis]|uniref:Two component transcriptional regulator, LuxR family n=1 Tax=Fodinibius sediminis TaxID=1214077 RepID=A0A521FD17_9BACT|nr:response regulator transcription factor [Fodinibius sediminis]SMO94087.1 two component transcriptional regulator, LuxR family [Fodinibius sediminis]